MRNLRRSARRHQAGVDSEEYYAFPVGARVMTIEGFPGTVTAVEGGAEAGEEQYLVTLDAEMGGGEYSSSELTSLDAAQVEAKTAAVTAAIPLQCSGCGETYFTDGEGHGCEGSLHDHWTEASQVEATGPHVASEDYPELAEILVQRPPLPHSERVARLRTADMAGIIDGAGDDEPIDLGMPQVAEAGLFDTVMSPWAEHMLHNQQQSGHGVEWDPATGTAPSIDWCFARHNSHCWYPKTLDVEGTKEAGYSVWTPEDRGICSRTSWDQQKVCPAPSRPGPLSGEAVRYPESWKSWEEGGQGRTSAKTAVEVDRSVTEIALDQKGNPLDALLDEISPENSAAPAQDSAKNPYSTGNPYTSSLESREAAWHLTASWKDVQAKAKRIRSEGHVRVISSTPSYLVGQVEGDTAVYQTTLTREPGTTRVATWECGCPWATYSWGRSGRWKKYEGRMCSHALALQYEGASRGWHGKEVKEDVHTPAWLRNRKVMVPGDYQPKPIGDWRKATLNDVFKIAFVPGGFHSFDDVADYMLAQIHNVEPRVTSDLTRAATEFDGEMEGLEFKTKGRDSLLRKLPLKAQSPAQLTQPFSVIRDALRYTICFPEPDWGNSVQHVLWELQSKGYKINSEESTWAKGDPYSGLHYDMQAPNSDIVFELQFHTTSSFDLKNKVLHKMYEEFRNPSTPLKRRQDLYDEMTKYWDKIPVPQNAMDFPNQKTLPRPTSGMRQVRIDPELAHPPVFAMVRDMLSDGDSPAEVIATLVGLGLSDAPGLLTQAMRSQPFKARVRGLVTDVLDLLDGAAVKVRGLGTVSADEVFYPTYNPVRGLTASKTASEFDNTVCIMAIPAQGSEVHDIGPEDKHATLLYFGDMTEHEDPERMQASRGLLEGVLANVAAQTAPFTAQVKGVEALGDDGAQVWMLDSPHLQRLFSDIPDVDSEVQSLYEGADATRYDSYKPHVTVGYGGPDVDTDTATEHGLVSDDNLDEARQIEEIPFDRLSLWWGDEHIDFPLTGSQTTAGLAEDLTEQQVADQFALENPSATEGCDICGDSGHTTDEHEAFPQIFDDANRTAAKDQTVSPSEHGDPRLQDAGVTVAQDDDGYYVRTHRARSDSYPSVEKIPQGDIDYIESTGAAQAAYYTEQELRALGEQALAELHTEPEAALPVTDGAEEPEVEHLDDAPEPGSPRLAWLMGGSTPAAAQGDKDMNIAQAAKAHLAKTALKEFTPAEQRQIIEEGSVEGVVARNLGDLCLDGTHYAVLEEALQQAEEGDDESWLY